MDITITINSAILQGTEKFIVRYRLLPSGAYSAYQDETNAPFTITGLSEGEYQFEIIFVRENGEECEAVYKYYTVYPEFSCISFTGEIVQDANGLYYVEISYTPSVNPPCGWSVSYSQGSLLGTSIPYATLPASPIRIPVPNASTDVGITALLCNGRSILCYSETLDAIDAPCTPIVITDVSIVQNPAPSIGYTLYLRFTQSTPATRIIRITYQQTGVPVVSATPLAGGTLPLGALPGNAGQTNQLVAWTVIPTAVYGNITFIGTMTDDCGVVHSFSATFD